MALRGLGGGGTESRQVSLAFVLENQKGLVQCDRVLSKVGAVDLVQIVVVPIKVGDDLGKQGFLGERDLSVAVVGSQGLKVSQLPLREIFLVLVHIALVMSERDILHIFHEILDGGRVCSLELCFDIIKCRSSL
jgi:hypothetical protein